MNSTCVIKKGLLDGAEDSRARCDDIISAGRIDIRIRDKIPEVLKNGKDWEPFVTESHLLETVHGILS